MQKHERFEELCALAVVGQLSPEEYDELSSHMRTCEVCCGVAQEYVDVIHHLPIEDLPLGDGEVLEMQEASCTEHFLSRAQTEGVAFSQDALRAAGARRSLWKRLASPIFVVSPAMAAAAALLLVSAVLWTVKGRQELPAVSIPAPPALVLAVRPQSPGASDPAMANELSSVQGQLASLKQEVTLLTEQLASAQRDRGKTQSELRQQQDLVTRLRDSVSQQERLVAQATSESQEASADRERVFASLVLSEARMRDLEAELRSAHASVEQERELNAAARDVRELMGARNLHIIDVYDSDNRLSPERSFGRVIYTEGKSLIFYAFDLDKAHGVRKVSFHAWGEREGDHREPKKLGVFYVDDAAQKRWVMKVNDPEKLAAIDTVFVTVESRGYVSTPSKQRLLQAFLGSGPNHP